MWPFVFEIKEIESDVKMPLVKNMSATRRKNDPPAKHIVRVCYHW